MRLARLGTEEHNSVTSGNRYDSGPFLGTADPREHYSDEEMIRRVSTHRDPGPFSPFSTTCSRGIPSLGRGGAPTQGGTEEGCYYDPFPIVKRFVLKSCSENKSEKRHCGAAAMKKTGANRLLLRITTATTDSVGVALPAVSSAAFPLTALDRLSQPWYW